MAYFEQKRKIEERKNMLERRPEGRRAKRENVDVGKDCNDLEIRCFLWQQQIYRLVDIWIFQMCWFNCWPKFMLCKRKDLWMLQCLWCNSECVHEVNITILYFGVSLLKLQVCVDNLFKRWNPLIREIVYIFPSLEFKHLTLFSCCHLLVSDSQCVVFLLLCMCANYLQ